MASRVTGGRRRAVLIALVALSIVASACSSKDDADDADGEGAGTTAPPAEEVLGEPNEATGTPIKIGIVSDGATAGVDNEAAVPAAKAAAEYANNHLGGLNGHPIEIETCETGQTPSGATTCAVEMVNAGVAAVIVGLSGQDAAIFKGLEGSGIPYITTSTGAPAILLGENAFVLSNPLAAFSATVRLAQDAGVERVAFIVVDLPAATGPINGIASPLFEEAGIDLDLVNVPPDAADMTPQVQDALSQGAGQFMILGDQNFIARGIRALRQAEFEGNIISATSRFDREGIATVPGGLEGVIAMAYISSDPASKDFQLYTAVLDTYAADAKRDTASRLGYVPMLALVQALEGVTTAVDGPSITAGLRAMPKPLPLPMGLGITFQCGKPPSPVVPSACVENILRTTLDADGQPTEFEYLEVAETED